MHLIKRLGSASLILAGVLLITACPSQTTISKINADPARYRNKEVAIVGTVRDSYGVWETARMKSTTVPDGYGW